MSGDPVAFAEAALEEDEAIALATISINDRASMRRGIPPPRWVEDDWGIRSEDRYGILRVTHTWASERAHITRHDPARALREVEAGRRILARHRECPVQNGYCERWTGPEVCPEMADLLYRWADRPGYDPAWKP